MRNKGFTLFISIVTAGTLLLVAAGMVAIAVRQSLIAYTAAESQYAFYAADTGMECAIYWDVSNPGGSTAFATSSGALIQCNGDAINVGNQALAVGGNAVSTFTLTFLPDPYCAIVTVHKDDDNSTVIESRGYNTCDLNNPRRVERAIRATY